MKKFFYRSQSIHAVILFPLSGILLFLLWVHTIEYLNVVEQPQTTARLTVKGTESTINKTNESAEEKLKYILLWPKSKKYPFHLFQNGQTYFKSHNCSFQNCYVTDDRQLLGGDVTKFNAIAFNGQDIHANDLPSHRSPHQEYIYFNTESADNYPVCSKVFDDFFNMTATYRLDSDLLFNYFFVRDKQGKIVGPKIDMKWVEGPPESIVIDNKVNKTKAVAWFVSNCNARSSRMEFAKNLQHALNPYGFTVDIYGHCGTKKCARKDYTMCNVLLRKDYYFYLSSENTFCEDYVTEKVLTALQNDLIPIVYGGADYYRFLPPHSFIDSRAYTVDELAALIAKLIDSPEEYRSYFGWKSHYTYDGFHITQQICSVCEALNRKPERKVVYEDFRRWWNPNFRERC